LINEVYVQQERRRKSHVQRGKSADPVRARALSRATVGRSTLEYSARAGVDAYVQQVRGASPLQLIELERVGVRGAFIKDLSERMNLPASRLFGVLGVSRATAARKSAATAKIAGASGHAAIGMAKLLGIAQELAESSTASGAAEFDAAAWLGRWIERPQPALGGRTPAELLSTPTGIEVVTRLLGSLESGAYQ
jgi:putative toxin-antitoxin system antitoxin component (TIGR02293 family)